MVKEKSQRARGPGHQVQEMGRLHLRVHKDDETPPSPSPVFVLTFCTPGDDIMGKDFISFISHMPKSSDMI